ncbi:hypothetical protein ACE1ET_02925 [Saccharicrinis sp. FJH62]|uniref:glycosyltransferase family protein n=1 Tax=Saccharicrinis sp. FJH62 TaxID=3344657 RepID=UPI0035D45DB6
MKKVLVIVRSFGLEAPQPIRFKHLISNWREDIEIHVLRFRINSKENNIRDNIKIHELNYGKIYRKLFNPYRSKNNVPAANNKLKKKKNLSGRIKREIKKLFFPDPLILEYPKIKKKVSALINEYKYDTVLVSCFPFTLLMLGKVIKQHHSEIKIMADFGDPFYGSSTIRNNSFRNRLAYLYEKKYLKYVDELIVVSDLMRESYIKCFNKSLHPDSVKVIQQGFNINIPKSKKKVTDNAERTSLKMIYAGRFYNKLREPGALIDALCRSENITLDVFGPDSPFNYHKGCNNIIYKGEISNDELNDLYAEYDIVVFIDNAFGKQIPGKLFELIATKCPILYIYNEASPCLKIMHSYKGAVCVLNEQDMVYKEIRDLLQKIKGLTFSYPIDKLSWKNLAEVYKKSL